MIRFLAGLTLCTFQSGVFTLGDFVLEINSATDAELQRADAILTSLGAEVTLDQDDGIRDAVLDKFWQLWETSAHDCEKTTPVEIGTRSAR